jgi:hypothetical protein
MYATNGRCSGADVYCVEAPASSDPIATPTAFAQWQRARARLVVRAEIGEQAVAVPIAIHREDACGPRHEECGCPFREEKYQHADDGNTKRGKRDALARAGTALRAGRNERLNDLRRDVRILI